MSTNYVTRNKFVNVTRLCPLFVRSRRERVPMKQWD